MKLRLILNLSLLTALLASCAPAAATPNTNLILTAAVETAVAQLSHPTATSAPTETPIPTATAVRTPPALPGTYQTALLKPEDLPRSYITDSCQYLKNKWDSTRSSPGTVVMVVMHHRIDKDATSSNAGTTTIAGQELKKLMNDLYELGFQAINMQQMADFMYENTKIPQRSVLLIVDDRGHPDKYDTWFRSYYEKWGWPIINAYIGKDIGDPFDNVLWQENAALATEGWIDYQAHGYMHEIPISEGSTDEFINAEMNGAIISFQKYFNKTPIAYIWPGGGFSKRSVEIGTQLGYKLGFTVNPRGPVMYNWVPQAETFNSSNPLAIPETPAGNPLMTLPRYMDITARENLNTVIAIGDEAAAYAEANKAVELEYYDIVCAPTYGPIP